MSGDSERIERLVKMAERLMEAIEADLAALKAGKPQAMRTIEPEMQRLTALYGREAQGFTQDSVKKVPSPLRNRFFETTSRFRDLLNLHARMIDARAQRQRRHDQGDCRRSRSPGCADADLFAHAGCARTSRAGDDLQQRHLKFRREGSTPDCPLRSSIADRAKPSRS